MQMAIRALGWATKLLWIIILVIVITIAYSATQINIAFGEPQTTTTAQAITISFPININNQGLYDLTQLNITTKITDQNSQTLADGTSIAQLVQRGTMETIVHSVTINFAQILTESSLIFNDTDLIVFQYVSLNYANAIPLSVHANYTMPWGAPLSNLAISNPTFTSYNTTHSIISVQLYFENHNQYMPVTGITRVEIYTARQTLKGTGTANIDAQPNTSYSTQVDVLVSNFRTLPPRGEIHVFFEVSAFNYGPVVIPFG
jgi:hypothetical protein